MNTSHLHYVCSQHPLLRDHYYGIYSLHNLPLFIRSISGSKFIIIYQSFPNKTYGHWTLLYWKQHNVYYFCSFGSKPTRTVVEYLKFVSPYGVITFNSIQLQSPFSPCCGYYVIYVASLCSISPLLPPECTEFSVVNFLSNDCFVISFYSILCEPLDQHALLSGVKVSFG